MELERERGITIKMQPVRMKHEKDGEKYEVKLREDKGIKPPKRKSIARDRRIKKPVQPATKTRQRRPRRVRRNVPPPPRRTTE